MTRKQLAYMDAVAKHLRWLVVEATKTNALAARHQIHRSDLQYAITDAMDWLGAYAQERDTADYECCCDAYWQAFNALDTERDKVLHEYDRRFSPYQNDPAYLAYKIKVAEEFWNNLNHPAID